MSSILSSSTTTTADTPPPTPKKSINWGIIGIGDVTTIKSGPPFYKCTGSNLVAVMRRTPNAATDWIHTQLPPAIASFCRGYDNLSDFLSHPNLDAVYVATPPGSHRDVALAVARKGLPCYVEKPVGRSGRETEEMIRAFEGRGVPFFTAYISRAYDRTRVVKELLQAGVVGRRVTSVSYVLRGRGVVRGLDEGSGGALPWRVVAEDAGGGLIMDVGCHVIDRLDYLLGPLVDVTGEASNRATPVQDVEDFVSLEARIGSCDWGAIESDGATVRCTWDFASDDAMDELVITGDAGSLKMAGMSPSSPVGVYDGDGKLVRELAFDQPQHTAQQLIQLVTDELRGVEGVVSPSRGDNALRTSLVLDKVLGGYYGGRDDEFWKRPQRWPGRRDG